MARLLFSFLIVVLSVCASVVRADPKFSIPQSGTALDFPRDHGAHPDFRTEWWYLTANLAADERDIFRDGTDFGLQLTFFRHGVAGSEDGAEWAQQYLAHAAVTDRSAGNFVFDKRYVRGGIGIAVASNSALDVTQGNWRLQERDGALQISFDVRKGDAAYAVTLTATKMPEVVRQGDSGYSKKGSCTECSSFYYSIPRIELSGEVVRGAEHVKVHGLGWLDHEWMSGAIDSSQVGWDWFGIMTKQGASIMAFQLRDEMGRPNFASASIVSEGSVRALGSNDFAVSVDSTWKSPDTGANYPSKWHLTVPTAGIDLHLTPVLPGQELSGEGQQYWEGAVRSEDSSALGYAELTGYVHPVGRL